mmetsp:Transcript_28481/g.51497  ORF Transcript_28481/g.51497 Transcript_28481/m.51497 type:complete len:447 (+) Transcript_28481:77-1417(+)
MEFPLKPAVPPFPLIPPHPFDKRRDAAFFRSESRPGGTVVAKVPRAELSSIFHRTSSVPSGIGEAKANTAVFPDMEEPPVNPHLIPPKPRRPPATLPKAECRFGRDVVPDSLQAMSYWDALDVFTRADVLKIGQLDRGRFYTMLHNISREKEYVGRAESDAVFEELDLDKSGYIDREEFMGWVFQTHNHYSGGVRSRLQNLSIEKATELYYRIDDNQSGEINREEFFEFLKLFSFEGGMTKEESVLLFKSIDTDHSGLIDLDEFLDWVFPQRRIERVRRLEKLRSSPLAQLRMRGGRSVELDADLSEKQAKAFEMEPGKPVILTFTIGRQFEPTFVNLQGAMSRTFGADRVQLRYILDPEITTCSRVVANVGSGMVLWDKLSMVPYRENPFLDQVEARNWVTEVLVDNLPEVLDAAKVEGNKKEEKRKKEKAKREKDKREKQKKKT